MTSLRTLKNELIGHDQRKEAFVSAGIIPALAQVLATRRPTGKAVTAELDGSALCQGSEDAKACLQAVLIVGSLAQGA